MTERILVIFMFVVQGDPQDGQFVGNCKTSPSRSSRVKGPAGALSKVPFFSSALSTPGLLELVSPTGVGSTGI